LPSYRCATQTVVKTGLDSDGTGLDFEVSGLPTPNTREWPTGLEPETFSRATIRRHQFQGIARHCINRLSKPFFCSRLPAVSACCALSGVSLIRTASVTCAQPLLKRRMVATTSMRLASISSPSSAPTSVTLLAYEARSWHSGSTHPRWGWLLANLLWAQLHCHGEP
jgi:hypothetical protein